MIVLLIIRIFGLLILKLLWIFIFLWPSLLIPVLVFLFVFILISVLVFFLVIILISFIFVFRVEIIVWLKLTKMIPHAFYVQHIDISGLKKNLELFSVIDVSLISRLGYEFVFFNDLYLFQKCFILLLKRILEHFLGYLLTFLFFL